MPVSDRRPLGGVSQFLSQFGFWAEPLARKPLILQMRRDVRVVEGARLESVCRGNSTVGSNPTLSARFLACGSVAGGSSGPLGHRATRASALVATWLESHSQVAALSPPASFPALRGRRR